MHHAVNDEALDIALSRGAHAEQVAGQARQHRAADGGVRSDAPGTDQREHLARADCVRGVERGERARLAPYLSEGNRAKTHVRARHGDHRIRSGIRAALPKLFPHAPGAKDWFADPKVAEVTAFRNGTSAGRLFHHGRARIGPRLRSHVGLRQCRCRSRIFSRKERSNRISSAASVMAIRRASLRAAQGSPSTKRARFSDSAEA